jgi:hypothetical protein
MPTLLGVPPVALYPMFVRFVGFDILRGCQIIENLADLVKYADVAVVDNPNDYLINIIRVKVERPEFLDVVKNPFLRFPYHPVRYGIKFLESRTPVF